jgi:ABC-2 type transport system permease protein
MISKSKDISLSPNFNVNRHTTSFWVVVRSTIIRDLIQISRYLPNVAGGIIQLFIRIMFFLLFSSFVVFQGENALSGNNIFVFFLAGIMLWMLTGAALNRPLEAVQNDLYNGTLEYLYSNPISRYAYYLGTVLVGAIINMVVFLPCLVLLVVYSKMNIVFVFDVILVSALFIGTLVALGIMLALLGLLWRQIGSIVGVLSLLFEMLCGAYCPVTQFPKVIQYIAYFFPFTWGYDLVRYYCLNRHWKTLAPITVEWYILAINAIVYLIVSYFLLKIVEKQVKKQGLHLI